MLNFTGDEYRPKAKFESLRTGSTFIFRGSPCMKIRIDGKYETINLDTGNAISVADSEIVETVNYCCKEI